MKLLDDYFKLQDEIYKYFGYVEDYVVIPIDLGLGYYWKIIGNEATGIVRFSESLDLLNCDVGEYYEHTIYTQRFLPKWVYRGKDYTMICVDTQVDGNKFLQIFSNDKEVGKGDKNEIFK